MPDDPFDDFSGSHETTMLELARERLRSQQRIERNTFWTMIAVAAHTGYGIVRDPPQLPDAQAAANALFQFLGWFA